MICYRCENEATDFITAYQYQMSRECPKHPISFNHMHLWELIDEDEFIVAEVLEVINNDAQAPLVKQWT